MTGGRQGHKKGAVEGERGRVHRAMCVTADVRRLNVQGDSGGSNGLSQRMTSMLQAVRQVVKGGLVPHCHCSLVNAVIHSATGLTIC